MSEELKSFVNDFGALMRERYNKSLAEIETVKSETDIAFQQGANFAYYDALDLMKSQLEAFGYDVRSFSFEVPNLGKKLG